MQQLLPWILASLSLALLLGAGIAWALRGRPAKQQPLPSEWTLAARPVFSADERRVFRQLREALPHHIVLSKLPLVRFSQPTDPTEVRYWYEVLGSQHVSFAACSANGRVLAAIDLESDRGTSRRSLQIKQSVLAACKVRYLRCTPGRLPSVPELQLLVPQVGPSARGPHAAAPAVSEARDQLASTLASKRRERTTLWADSGYMQDSFFGTDRALEAGVVSGFGALQSHGGVLVREVTLRPDEIIGGVVQDLPAQPAPSPLRH
jgi:Protein of unknown function (DUF2726)